MEHDYRDIKQLYLAAHRGEQEPPDFDRLVAGANATKAASLRRFTQFALAAAAVVMIFAGGYLYIADSPEYAYRDVVALGANGEGRIALENGGADLDEWEDLLEFADSIWEWESPTDFLIAM